jgi:microcystin-dependent protein
MSEPFMGQILFAAFNYAPKNYGGCDGATLSIAQNTALFSLLGTTYGGDGQTTFRLPDLRGRTPVASVQSADGGWQPSPTAWGQVGGTPTVQLTLNQIPMHNHTVNVSSATGNASSLAGATFGVAASNFYGSGPTVGLTGSPMANAGANQPHNNMQPFAVIEVAIALTGFFPSRG